ncbi:MAG: hypothetical protein IJ837_03695 [Clostridia bacterium]|nr:hypothetical protein [Clostridia bacterium]
MEKITENQDFLSPYIFRKLKRIERNKPWSKSYWLNIGDEKYMFKYDERAESNAQKLYSEIIISKLCEKFDVPCVKYIHAVNESFFNSTNGVMVKSFLKNDEQEISFKKLRYYEELKKIKDLILPIQVIYANFSPICFARGEFLIEDRVRQLLNEQDPRHKRLLKMEKDFLNRHKKELTEFAEKDYFEKNVTIQTHIDRAKEYCDKYGYKIEGNLKLQLQKIAIIDNITRQTDRQEENMSLILNPQTKTARLAPLFDNGNTFGFAEKVRPGEYPYCSRQYIELTESDYKEMADKTTEIGAFYEKVKNFQDEDLNGFLEQLKIEAKISRDNNKKYFKDESLSAKSCDKYVDDVKGYYKRGIDFLENNIKKYGGLSNNLPDEENKINF